MALAPVAEEQVTVADEEVVIAEGGEVEGVEMMEEPMAERQAKEGGTRRSRVALPKGPERTRPSRRRSRSHTMPGSVCSWCMAQAGHR